jgi:hypothetical protein
VVRGADGVHALARCGLQLIRAVFAFRLTIFAVTLVFVMAGGLL